MIRGISNNSIFPCQATHGSLFHKAHSWPHTIFRDAHRISFFRYLWGDIRKVKIDLGNALSNFHLLTLAS